jgi:hypothetical protein
LGKYSVAQVMLILLRQPCHHVMQTREEVQTLIV